MISVHFVAFFILDIINDSQVISVLLFIFYAAQMTEIEGIKYIVVHLLEALHRGSTTRISRAHLSDIEYVEEKNWWAQGRYFNLFFLINLIRATGLYQIWDRITPHSEVVCYSVRQMNLQYGHASPNLHVQYLQVQYFNMVRLRYFPYNSLSLHLFFCISRPYPSFPLFHPLHNILCETTVGYEKYRSDRIFIFLMSQNVISALLDFYFCRSPYFKMA